MDKQQVPSWIPAVSVLTIAEQRLPSLTPYMQRFAVPCFLTHHLQPPVQLLDKGIQAVKFAGLVRNTL